MQKNSVLSDLTAGNSRFTCVTEPCDQCSVTRDLNDPPSVNGASAVYKMKLLKCRTEEAFQMGGETSSRRSPGDLIQL